MVKKVSIKTTKNSDSVVQYLESLEDPLQVEQGKQILELFEQTLKVPAKMWGSSIVGFGEYTYYRANGDVGNFMATGFSMRKSGPVFYVMPGYKKADPYLKRLGKHSLGKSCLYVKKLSDIDTAVLQEMIVAGIEELKQTHNVRMR